ncbi:MULTISPECIES: [FeFe] hydrogenase H-cluster maturation GTPase HydF [unclassified Fusibacter]|uniref:[FeFe] hydrogenase H-cluster maturation GTPase HydF n=1 Tax=unclassified Fusibacter TaxID=2624464 RepID=UPI001011A0E4|nr:MULTISPECIES: [FeFe] hydrogenase H-cluster maturation GTPase HydF [unclassified Fusibacter]MCK8061660.1 [FeFe] hydrogenase H-cluster maturation GTPase HydF [Fusibacter sp. A2]NPE23844.1 [FeFe] hydrogenase H-cluster maturation GTPase HydF [Fusibacter sp. A1]RXV58617.1 [FeFe] hydrogenase H-cluster maturation GTPase HydF [Fusibacter sp. A1]
MSMNQTPRSQRPHIALFGRRNAGKSSVINAVTDQEIAIVSGVKGTTTDPVYKSMEILPLGPVVVIDTAGLDDEGELGELRIKKTLDVLNKTDIALVVIDSEQGITDYDKFIINKIKEKKIGMMIVFNKTDIHTPPDFELAQVAKEYGVEVMAVSAFTKAGVKKLKKKIAELQPVTEDKFKIVGDLVAPGDFIVLVTPIDKAAPKGRLILPQQQTIRDILESDAIAIITKEHELREALDRLGTKPKLVITDSQAFLKVSADTPKDIPLTSFSILFARYKGDLNELVRGAKAIESLKDGSTILVSEGCTHHRQADDIGKVKIPRWLRQLTGKELNFEHTAGTQYTEDVKKYDLIIHCGACMLNKQEMTHRINQSKEFGVPIVNYGVMIAYVQGIMDRALEPFPLAKMIWDEKE